jgi:hypothetical protein
VEVFHQVQLEAAKKAAAEAEEEENPNPQKKPKNLMSFSVIKSLKIS